MAGIAVLAMVGAVASGAAPVGLRPADLLVTAGFAGLVVLAATVARPWTWWFLAVAAIGVSDGWAALAAAGAALLLCGAWWWLRADPDRLARHPWLSPVPIGALVGGLATQVLLRGADLGFHGSSAVAAAVGVLPLLWSGYRRTTGTTRRRLRVAGALAGCAVGLAGAGFALAVLQARPAIEQGRRHLAAGVAAASQADDAQAARHLAAAHLAFDRADTWLSSWWARPAETLPLVGYNARAGGALVATAAHLTDIAATAAGEHPTEVLTAHDGKIDLDGLQALEDPLGRMVTALDLAATRVRRIDGPWLTSFVAGGLDQTAERLDETRADTELALDTVRLVPEMLGGDQPRRWLVAFVTPVEARGRSGFMGNYAELVIDNGDVELAKFGRGQDLTSAIRASSEARVLSGPDDYLARWERFAPDAEWRNITMSPDFPRVGQVMAQLYPQSGGKELDGVIAVDPSALAALLELTGPVEVPGVDEPVTADTVEDFLLRGQYEDFPDVTQRTAVLASFARATFAELSRGELEWADMGESLGAAARAGHIQMYSVHDDQQRLLRRADLDGALPAAPGHDLVAVVNNNAGGNKVDLFLSRQVAYQARWDPATGDVAAELTVRLTNDAPTSGLPDYVIGNALDDPDIPTGTNRTHLSVYSALELAEAQVDGEPVAVEHNVEAGRSAYSLFLDIPPEGGQRTFRLELRGRLPSDGRYRLDVATQPLVVPDRLDLSVAVPGDQTVTARSPLHGPDQGPLRFHGLVTSAVTRYEVDARQ